MSEKEHTTGKVSWKHGAYAILAALLLVLPWLPVSGPYFLHVCILILTYIIATSSLRTIYVSGQSTIGHAIFMGIGAYTSALLAMRLGWTPWLTIPLGAVSAAVVAIVSGYFFSRTRTFYFSMVTLFFGVAVEALIRSWASLTGGRPGLINVPGMGVVNIPGIGGIDFAASKVPHYYLLLFLAFVSLLVLYRLERSRTGMNWMAIAQSPLVASSIGISETKFRVLAFAVGCFFAGLAGGAYGHYSGVISPSSFDFMASINLVIFMLFGGIFHFAGPVIGVIVLIAIPEVFRSLKEYAPFVFGGVMLLVIFLMPQGLAGIYGSARPWLSKFVRKD
jgi:branched-chain amino acid transport system permease protein